MSGGTSVCKCGKTIHWRENVATGKSVPLVEIELSVYVPEERGVSVRAEKMTVLQNHFLDCPDANEFSGRSKK